MFNYSFIAIDRNCKLWKVCNEYETEKSNYDLTLCELTGRTVRASEKEREEQKEKEKNKKLDENMSLA